MQHTQVSAVRCTGYTQTEVLEAVQKHFAAFSFFRQLTPDTRVLLKPNLLMKRTPEEGTTTHPALVRAVVQCLQQAGVRHIVLADSPGGPFTPRALTGIYKATGMAQVAQETGIVLNLETGWQSCRCENGVACKEFNLMQPVLDADVVINLPKLKTHAMAGLSGGVKNLFGCVPGLQKPQFHFRFPQPEDFSRMLLDLALLVRPAFTLVDAVVAMEGDGPSAGRLRQAGMTFAAENVFALDLALADYIGMPPNEIWTVRQAVASGLCPPKVRQLVYVGDGMPEPQNFLRPSSGSPRFSSRMPRALVPVVRRLENALSPRPVIRRRDCIGCGKCAESCAPQAISIVDHKAHIAQRKCIRCFCCHEMCPVRAVDIHRVKLLDR